MAVSMVAPARSTGKSSGGSRHHKLNPILASCVARNSRQMAVAVAAAAAARNMESNHDSQYRIF